MQTERIQEELERLAAALRATPFGERYSQLYAAQQALAWVLESNIEAPFHMIDRFSTAETDTAPPFRALV